MKQVPHVSVVIPTYNRMDLLPETVHSVLSQTFTDIEVIVVDDGSSDGTQQAIEAISDPRLRYHRNQWSGHPSVGRNTGIRLARGEYIAFLDSDDLWLPEKLERQLRFLDQHPEQQWCFCQTTCFLHETGKDHGAPYPAFDSCPSRPEALLLENYIPSPTPLVSAKLFERAGTFNEDPALRFSEDWEMWLRLWALARPGYLAEPLTRYRLHGSNASRQQPQTVASRKTMALVNAAEASPASYRDHVNEAFAIHCLPLVRQLLVQGETKVVASILGRIHKASGTGRFRLYSILCRLPRPLLRLGLRLRRVLVQPTPTRIS